MADPRIKQLRIQGGVVKRTAKEMAYYQKEADDYKVEIGKMKEAGGDEYYIGKKNELMQETILTSEDTKRRLAIAVEKLSELVENSSEDLAESKEYKEAVAALDLAQQ